MSEQERFETLAQRQDYFTCLIALLFFCTLSAFANGFFDYGARLSVRDDMGGFVAGSMRPLALGSLYVLPGLLCGLAWRKWGFLFGAGTAVAARLLTVVNLGMIVPYFGTPKGDFSFETGLEELILTGFLGVVAVPAAAGAVSGLLGQVLSRTPLSRRTGFRWARRLSSLALMLGFVGAAGGRVYSFPLRTRIIGGEDDTAVLLKLDRFRGAFDRLDGLVVVVIWLSASVLVICLLLALGRMVSGRLGTAGRQAEGTAGAEAPEAAD